jgi:hypothetical protein
MINPSVRSVKVRANDDQWTHYNLQTNTNCLLLITRFDFKFLRMKLLLVLTLKSGAVPTPVRLKREIALGTRVAKTFRVVERFDVDLGQIA